MNADEYLRVFHPAAMVMQWKVLSILRKHPIKTLLDVGGVGKIGYLTGYDVVDAGPQEGMDGCDLPYEKNTFDAVVSVATIEHVKDPVLFVKESFRVASKLTVHWFPGGPSAAAVEKMKTKYGHFHPCNVPDKKTINAMAKIVGTTQVEVFLTCSEELLLCMTLTPALRVKEVYDFIMENYLAPYGMVLVGKADGRT